ncbi:hypothetical protein ILUMI_10180 [Ignelater luminosus]|uniref:Uncharacterized protein n=1 Tax=Ignelater luminosus TaxID=2038154 RepID=A0A8K0GDV3_IGNLU|nr:hypothetical protein ILUMI_10180 [Ignelater luminosus]
MIVLILCHRVSPKIRDTSEAFTARQTRSLIYPEGTNWVQMVVGIGFPVELRKESVTWGATLKSYYLLPTNSNDILHPSIDYERKRRSFSRWDIYSAIKNFMDKFNFGTGKSCLMRAICEAALAPFDEKTGLLAEIMHVVLTPSTTSEEVQDYTDLEYHAAEELGKTSSNCARLFSECSTVYFLEQLTKIFT